MDMIRLAQDHGITVEYCNLPKNKSISVQDDGGDFILMDYSLIRSGPRERVHLGHEIGHCVRGAFYEPHAPLEVRRKCENAADRWFIEKIIPKDSYQKALESGYTEVWELAEHFNVTEDFIRKAACWYTYGNLAVDTYY